MDENFASLTVRSGDTLLSHASYAYDGNEVVRLIRPNEYDPETDSGDGFQFTYDAQGRVLTVLSPDGHVLQSNTYDADGRLLQRLDGVGSGVKYEYDFTGAQRRMESMGGASQELEYDARGRITGIVDGNGNETKYLLDEWGRITGVVKADGSTERYAYNFAGDMVSSTDGEGHTTQYEYNRMGKISAIVDPTGERETYHYDGQGRLIRKTDRNGVTVELGYNLYGAPLFKKEKDGAQGDFYEYTPEGLLKCAFSQGMRYAYEYDEMGRMTRKSASGRTLLALEYDRNGNKVRQVDVTGKLTGFDYDPMGQLLRLTDDGQELAAYTYNPDGTPRAVAHGPIRQEYAYDLDKNLTGLTVRSGDALLSQTSYAYDGNGNRIWKQALDGTTLYQYDALNQLQREDYPAYSEELFYDKAGNRARRLVGGEEELYQYDPRNRLMALTRGGVTAPFQYDNAGNLLQDDKARYSYDAFNRTVKVETFDGNVQVNRYDAEGLRHEMEENGRLVRFIFHKGEAVVEHEENSNVIRLIRGSELIARSSDSESARTYYHYASDEMGSTTHIVDENGNVQNRYAYDAWGKIEVKEEAVLNRFTYYGQQIDPITQQYYLRARFYNPVIGRFTQEDTYRGDGLNLYAYCANNPVYYVDPSGFDKDALGNTSLVPYDPHFASEQRMWDGEIYFDSKTNRWKEVGSNKFVATPSSQMGSSHIPSGGTATSVNRAAELAGMSPLEIGNYLHYDSLNGGAGTKLPSDLAAMYPQTDFRFARRGEAGVDVEVVGGIHPSDTSVYPGTHWPANANYGDFKPNTPSGWKKLQEQIRNKGYDPNTVFLPYDPETGQLLF